MKNLLHHKAAPHFALGLMLGAIPLIATEGRVNLPLLALFSLVVVPAMTLTAVHIARITERRQLENTYNRPAHGEDQ
ncbi:hypothetical protein [Streptomyces sp. NPDC058092]|uniref:hypothetical protein n=1 Tax=Streptomyces sp. NPDC058092 TaxID=3346336 RepID=UPI0036E21482